MKFSFGASKFLTMLFAGTLAALASYSLVLCDAVILGHVIGEDALAGVCMVLPLLSVATFFATMNATGTAINYLISIGKNDHDCACRFFTQGFWTALGVGLTLSAMMYFFRDAYIESMNGSEYVVMYAEQYMRWAWAIPFVECIFMLAVSVCFAEGDLKTCSIGLISALVVKIVASYYLADSLGMGAAAGSLGSAVCMLFALLIVCVHFFRKTNTIRLTRHFSPGDSLRIFRSAFADRSIFLCNAALFFVLIRTVNDKFGSDVLPVASAAIALWNLMQLFGGVGFAAQPLIAVYHGEGNTRAILRIMRLAIGVAVAEAVLFMAVVLAFPELIIWFTGLEYPDLVSTAAVCIRVLSIGMVALSLAFLLKAYFLFIERPYISLLVAAIADVALPIVGVLVGSQFGLSGVWLGLSIGPILGLIVVLAILRVIGGRDNFPLMIPRVASRKILMFSLKLNEREITRVSTAISKTIEHELVGKLPDAELKSVAMRSALLVEEVFMVVRERNANRKKLLGEVTLNLTDGITLTLRDDGKIFDITDVDAEISSLRSFLVASVMEKQRYRMNLLTTGFNRNVFKF